MADHSSGPPSSGPPSSPFGAGPPMFPVSDRAVELSHVFINSGSPILAVVIILLGVRLATRFHRAGKLGWDDVFIILGTVSCASSLQQRT